jgi:hypothetical protein
MGRCLSQVMKLSLLLGAAILSVGWALSEARPLHHRLDVVGSPPLVDTPMPPPAESRQARLAPPLPPRPLPPPLLPPPRRDILPQVARISGRIVDLDGHPRPEVKADLDSGDVCMWIYTDATGRFTATVAPGDYTISAVGENDAASPPLPLHLQPGEEVHDLVLELGFAPEEELETEVE